MDDLPAFDHGVTQTGFDLERRPVDRITLSNGHITCAILTRGAILHSLRLAGQSHSLTVGSPDLAAYGGPLCYFGAIVGPVANRIAGGIAVLDGQRHSFEINERDRTLHSGPSGVHARNWEIDIATPAQVVLTLNLPDGTGGFPGNRAIAARYALVAEDTLELRIAATTDAATWINFASHAYWNLDGTPDLSGHRLRIAADRYLPTDATALVTGEIADVAGTPFDFRQPRPVGPGTEPRLDHNFCLADRRREPTEVLTLTGASGQSMTVSTTEPGVQVFDAGPIDGGGALDFSGRPIGAFAGLAIEPQGWPDAPNRPAFPPVVLRGGFAVEQVTRFRFHRD